MTKRTPTRTPGPPAPGTSKKNPRSAKRFATKSGMPKAGTVRVRATARSDSATNLHIGDRYVEYVEALLALDLLAGPMAGQELSDSVRPLVEATHKVLAGGRLASTDIVVVGDVNQPTVARLDGLLNAAVKEVNELNRKRRPGISYG